MRTLVTIAIAGLVTVALTSARTTRAANDGVTEARQQAACDAFWERKRKREQLAHDTEPKDPAWAYPMEQKLSEYTARRFRASQIAVTAIDCKTTFCTIAAEGFVPETNKEFDRAITYLTELGDFGGVTLSRREESGKMLYGAEVRRGQSSAKTSEQLDEERTEAACGELMSRQNQRERAARDAQPKDVSWAGPTEQLLREYFASQLVKHPVDKLEVTCRTTFCLVKASGRTFEAYSSFHKAARETVAEQWSDVEFAGGEGKAEGDIWSQEFTFDRRSARPH
jgi:hypothetical protein